MSDETKLKQYKQQKEEIKTLEDIQKQMDEKLIAHQKQEDELEECAHEWEHIKNSSDGMMSEYKCKECGLTSVS